MPDDDSKRGVFFSSREQFERAFNGMIPLIRAVPAGPARDALNSVMKGADPEQLLRSATDIEEAGLRALREAKTRGTGHFRKVAEGIGEVLQIFDGFTKPRTMEVTRLRQAIAAALD